VHLPAVARGGADPRGDARHRHRLGRVGPHRVPGGVERRRVPARDPPVHPAAGGVTGGTTMVTLVLPRLAARSEQRLKRATAVAGRNVAAARHFGYWWVLFSGFFEPVLYLLSIGIGVGALVKGFTLPDGRHVSYAAFVAPAMLA